MATTSMSRRACSTIDRRTSRPMRPKPLMATRSGMEGPLNVALAGGFAGLGAQNQGRRDESAPAGKARRPCYGGPERTPLAD
jgi:hypothetical protein